MMLEKMTAKTEMPMMMERMEENNPTEENKN
jgi:hypothetical protein